MICSLSLNSFEYHHTEYRLLNMPIYHQTAFFNLLPRQSISTLKEGKMNSNVKEERNKRIRRKHPTASNLSWLLLLSFCLPTVGKGTSRTRFVTEEITHNTKNNIQFSQAQWQQKKRNLDRRHQRNYYQFLDDDVQSRRNTTSLSDVWLCLSCALGW